LCWIRRETAPGLLAHHGHLHFRHDVGVQRDADRMLADGLQRTLRHADLRLVDLESLLGQRFGDVVVRDRTEQAAVDAGLGRDPYSRSVQLLAFGLRRAEAIGLGLLEVGSTRFEFLDRSLGGATRLALRDQEVARVAFLDLDHIAELAQVDDSFQEDDLHVRSPVQCVSV
jgi:hypothetical protein